MDIGTMIMGIVLGSIFGAAFLFLYFLLVSALVGAPSVPTSPQRVARMLELLELRPGELLIDLGSGDGRIVIAAAERGARAVGYEINPFLVLLSRVRIKKQGFLGVARVAWKDLWNVSLAEADAITVFGAPAMMPALVKKIRRETKPGTRIVSYVFSLSDMKPVSHQDGIFLYRI